MSTSQTIAGRFKIADLEKDLLGQGGMGAVYRGIDLLSGQAVAIKALKRDIVAGNPELVARFIREGEALRQLDHPNIVSMLAAVEEEGQHYLVVEYVEGGSLRELLDRTGPLPVRRVMEICLDLADALTRAHRLEIIHRDLKPENVLLATDGTPRLNDFGVARYANLPSHTQAGMIVGTIEYLSPEACRGETLDGRADIWALGVMLYEMLTGKRPFTGPSITAVLTAILTNPTPDLALQMPGCPEALVDLVTRMLDKDRHQRIPSVRLVGAELEAILQERAGPHSVPVAASRFATPSTSYPHRRTNLPSQATPFIGREAELAELGRLLSEPGTRLLTILGPGGMGKTRLALEAAAAQLDRFPHGVFLVSLAPLTCTTNILPAIAEALGFTFYNDARGEVVNPPRQQLLDYLSQKRLLLVIDNFEHLLDGAELVNAILTAARGVKVLATSRARLNLQSEGIFQLSGMQFPDWETPADAHQYGAVRLFLQSARRVVPGFELQSADLIYIARICRLVQGMPLAILLAAAWVELLSPAEIAAEIGRSGDFLQTDLRDVPERQRSIRRVFDYSWNLLSPAEQEVFSALSVLRGGFTRQAAQEVTGASLRDLAALVNKSLLHRTPAGRYEIHELLRQYAAEYLERDPARSEAIHAAHCRYYVGIMAQCCQDLRGACEHIALDVMRREFDNARLAWEWAAGHGLVHYLAQSVDALFAFCWQYVRPEPGEMIFKLASEKLAGFVAQRREAGGWGAGETWGQMAWLQARLLARYGVFSWWMGREYPSSERLIDQSLALLDETDAAGGPDTRAERAFILWQQGWAASGDEAREKHEQSLALYRAVGDVWWQATTLSDLGQAYHDLGQYSRAWQTQQESLALRRELGSKIGISDSLWLLSMTAWVQGRMEESEALARESLQLSQEINDASAVTQGLRALGETLLRQGKFAESQALLENSRASAEEMGNQFTALFTHLFLLEARVHQGQYEPAIQSCQNAQAFFTRWGFRWGIAFSYYVQGLAWLGLECYDEARRALEGSLPLFRAIGQKDNLGWVLALLGYANRSVGRREQAWQYVREALQIGVEVEAAFPLLYGLPAVALLLLDAGRVEEAAVAYTLARRYAYVRDSFWFTQVAGRCLSGALPPPPPGDEQGDLFAGARRLLPSTQPVSS